MSDGSENRDQETATNWNSKNRIIHEIQLENNFSCTDSSTWSDNFFCFLCCFAIVLFVGAMLFAAYAMLRSDIGFPFKLEVISLQLTTGQSSEKHNYMFADLNLTLSFTSQERQQVLIEPSLVSIKYGDGCLSSIKTDALYLVAKGNTTIVLDTGFNSSQLKNTTIESMANDLAIHHALELTLAFKGRFWILEGTYMSDQGLDIVCEGTKVNFPASNSSTGTMVDAPRRCKYAYT